MNKLLVSGIVGGLTLVGAALFLSLKTDDDDNIDEKETKLEEEKEKELVKEEDTINFIKKTKSRRNSHTSNKRNTNLKSNTRRNNKKLLHL